MRRGIKTQLLAHEHIAFTPSASVGSMVFSVGLFAVVISMSVVIAEDPECARNYTVKLGDICDSISAAQGVSTFQLAHVNPQIDVGCHNLLLGESLCLGIEGQDCRVTTVMRTGDTCQTISANAGIPVSLLLENNPNINSTCGNMYPGEVLCTANRVFLYT